MSDIFSPIFLTAAWETIYMVFIASFFSILLGLGLGSFVFLTGRQQLNYARLHQSLELLINVTRSIPFIILMIAVIPITRLLVGTTIGTNAAIVPLTLAAIPFFARICENALTAVPTSLIETGHAMGASTLQILTKILIPESLPALIRGATLTVIGLIGYSAMAGVIGGGGLGELAINYGYQRFDAAVMLETVVILILMVQFVQVTGDWIAKKRRIKTVLLASIFLWLGCLTYQFWPTAVNNHPIRIGVMSGLSEQVMETAKQVAKDQYGIDIQVVTFNDYVQPNTALANGSIDANIFQHAPYLEAQVKARHFEIVPLAKTFVYPMGFYSHRIKTIDELHDNAVVAIPNDPSNGGRALLILQKQGLIELKPGASILAGVKDIIANPKHLQFKLLDAAQLPRSLNDVDLAAITNDFVGPAGLTIQRALLKEGKDSPYANLIVIREQDKTDANLNKLVQVMHSEKVTQQAETIFPNGAAIPAW